MDARTSDWSLEAIVVPDSLLGQISASVAGSRFGDAWLLAQKAGPIEKWTGAEAKLLGGRLARHLGSQRLYWRLTAQACREQPYRTRFQTQRVYAVMEKRGSFAAWLESQKFARCKPDTAFDQAEALASQGNCHVIFRDFEEAGTLFEEAQRIAPESPWVWAESSSLAAEQADYAKAIAIADRALAIDPYHRPALQRKAGYLQSLQREDEAISLLKAACDHVQSAAVFAQLASIFSEREAWAAMLPLLDEGERLSPLADEENLSWYKARRTDALLGQGRNEEAALEAGRVTENKFYERLAERLRAGTASHRRVRLAVPFVQQDYNTCAPATLSAVTSYWGAPISQDTLIGEICYDGTYDFVERKWAAEAGWHAREFKVTWDIATALLDRDIPFILTTQEITIAHSQAIIGYDTRRQSLLLRDPSMRHFTEYAWSEFEEHYAPTGPRGLLLLPPGQQDRIAGVDLPEAELYDLLFQHNCALDAHDRARAGEILAQFRALAPNHRLTWAAMRALASYDQNPVAHLEAIEGLRQFFPDDDRLLNSRLDLLRSIGRAREATQLLRERGEKPKMPELFRREHARDLQFEKNKSGAAIRLTLRSLALAPRDLDNLTLLSDILWRTQKRREAIAIQHLAVCLGDKKEGLARAYFGMREAVGETEPALDFLRRRASSLLSQSSAPIVTLIDTLHRLDRASDVRHVLEWALAQRPEDGDLHLSFARFEAASGNYDESRKHLARAEPNTRSVHWLREAATLEKLLGNFEQALAHWQALVQLSPLDTQAHGQVAWLLARRDGKPAAQHYLRELGAAHPFHRGILETEVAWLKEPEPLAMEERLRLYLETNPADGWARRERALLLQDRNALEEAMAEAREAREYEPFNSISWQIEGSVHESIGRLQEARDFFRRAIALDVDSVYGLRRLTLLSETPSEKEEALSYIRTELDRQTTDGPALTAYRECAFPLLEIDKLTADLRTLWQQRLGTWEAWHALLHQLLAVGKMEEAQQIAEGAAARFPILPAAWHDAARLNQRLGAWEAAADCLRHALRLNPDWTLATCDLAEVLRRLNQFDAAREVLEKAHHRNPLAAPVLGTLADLIWHQGDHDQALELVQRAIENDPHYNWGWNTLAEWNGLLHRPNTALDLARARARRLQNDAEAWLLVAQLSNKPEMAAERLEAATQARACDPRNANTHDAVAIAFANQRRYAEALQACRPDLFGNRPPMLLRGREAWLKSQQGKQEDAVELMKAVVAEYPHYFWGWDRLSDWHFQANRYADALQAAEKIVRLSPLQAMSYGKRARVFLKLTRWTDARNDFQKALALDPSYGYAGWQLLELQLKDKAFDDAEQTLALMAPHVSPAAVLPGRAALAARRQEWPRALELLGQTALLLEVDGHSLEIALEALDAGGQKKATNKLLTSLSSNPSFHPHVAAVWADRIGLVTKWNLFSYLKKVPTSGRAFEAVIKYLVLNAKKLRHPITLLNKLASKYWPETRKHTSVWAVFGQIYTNYRRWKAAVRWLSDWETRPDALGWMVTNLVFSLHMLGRTGEADAISRNLLARGLRDHTSAFHLLYLALSALEQKETPSARELLQGVHLEGDRLDDKLFKLAVEQTLLVQEAPSDEKKVVFNQARQRLKRLAPSGASTGRVKKAVARAKAQMAKDSGSHFAWIHKIRIPLPSWSIKSRGVRVLVILGIILASNLLRTCSGNH